MKKTFLQLLLITLAYFPIKGVAQDSTKKETIAKDTILKLDGKSIISRTSIDTTNNILFYQKPSNIKKIKSLSLEEIFSIKNNKGEQIIYKQDTLGNDFTLSEMKFFIKGEQDAHNSKLPKIPFITNFILSSAAGLTGHIFSPLAPLCISGAFSLGNPKIKGIQYPNNSSYTEGYQFETKKRRRKSALLGGGIGLLGGLITSMILDSNDTQLFK